MARESFIGGRYFEKLRLCEGAAQEFRQTLRSNNSHNVVVVRRISNRAGGIRSQRAHRQIRRHCGRGTAAGSTGNPCGVVRITGLAAEAAPTYAGRSILIRPVRPNAAWPCCLWEAGISQFEKTFCDSQFNLVE